jgi:hypothetical protein
MMEKIVDANPPRPYNLEDKADRARLLRETLGYAHVSIGSRDGTDRPGREFAHDALKHALMLGYRLVGPEKSS